MRKQILKGFAMLVLIVATAFATAVVSANGQTSSTQLIAEIPFEFVVGDRSLPSGKYAVTSASGQGDVLMIRGTHSKASAMRLSNSIQPDKSNGRARLVFHRYGQNYFLAEVWSDGRSTGRALLKSRQERAIERELASIPSRRESAANKYERIEVVATLR